MSARHFSFDRSLDQVPRLLAALAAVTLTLVLATIAVGITMSHRQSEHQILTNLQTRATTSAGFVSTFLSQQADRQRETARTMLAGRTTSAAQFRVVISSFGSRAAVLLNKSGRVLQIAPRDARLLGSDMAMHYAHLRQAEAGHAAVSGVVPYTARHQPVVAIAVPYSTPAGRRVLSLAYPVSRSLIAALVKQATVLRPHRVVLVDATGKIVAANPTLPGATLSQGDPALAAAISRSPRGTVQIAGADARYVSAPVAGTSWRLVIATADSQLFESIDGAEEWLPWIVFTAVGIIGLLALGLLARSMTIARRLAVASAQLTLAAQTDTVTGLLNRRALEERLAQAVAHARRYHEPLSALMIDLDHFKQFNDAYGHETGDQILRLVADSMGTVFRQDDSYGRWGGDEFLAILPATNEIGAQDVAQRLRDHAHAIGALPADVTQEITLSVGVATTVDAGANDLLRQADIALYRVKHARAQGSFTSV